MAGDRTDPQTVTVPDLGSGRGWPDAAELWSRARRAADHASADDLERGAGCLLAGVTEMAVAAGKPSSARAFLGLAGDAPTTSVPALAYLGHANLADDSFDTACHPGLSVLPAALVFAAQADRPISGEEFLRALLSGYEVACSVTRLLMPTVSRRGWRVSSVVAPLAAAATVSALSRLSDALASSAVALASIACGGPLSTTVDETGDGWCLQPALAAQTGVLAVQAARGGVRGGRGALEGAHSIWTLFGSEDPTRLPEAGRLVHAVTFKQYETAMFGQAVFDAVHKLTLASPDIRRVDVALPRFAVEYGGGGQGGIAGVDAIVHAAFAARGSRIGDAEVAIAGRDDLAALESIVGVTAVSGETSAAKGSGDTSGWTRADFIAHAVRRNGDEWLAHRCFQLIRTDDVRRFAADVIGDLVEKSKGNHEF